MLLRLCVVARNYHHRHMKPHETIAIPAQANKAVRDAATASLEPDQYPMIQLIEHPTAVMTPEVCKSSRHDQRQLAQNECIAPGVTFKQVINI